MAPVLALAGPLVIGGGATFVSGRGSAWAPGWLLVVAAVPYLLSLGSLLARRPRRTPLTLIAHVELLGLLAFLASFTTWPRDHSTAQPHAPYTYALPPAQPPHGLTMHRIETGAIQRTASFAYRSGGFGDARTFAMNALLIQHPAGDLLIDTGLGAHVDEQLAEMPLPFQWVTRLERRHTAHEALVQAGYDLNRLLAIVLTHGHWDHVSGAAELDPVPVWLPHTERTFIRTGWISAAARTLPPRRLQTYTFPDGPYLHFPRSRDVHGDGSVVLVPCPGHTPGSIIVFVALPNGQRYALIGDLAWQLEGVHLQQERPWLTRLSDHNPRQVRLELARIAAMHARYPQIDLVPAHDPRGYHGIPRLVQETGE